MMRDANRMVAIDPPFGMYIFNYINVDGETIPASSNQMQLHLNGRKIGVAPCEELLDKMLQGQNAADLSLCCHSYSIAIFVLHGI